jgi:hypothetical protein
MMKKKVVNPDRGLNLQAVWGFVAFALLTLLAFWPSYFSRPFAVPETRVLIFNYFPSFIGIVPVLDGNPQVQVIGFVVADVLLLILAGWDWIANKRKDVFPVALGVMVAYHVSVLTFYRLPFWKTFSDWFVSLPLS